MITKNYEALIFCIVLIIIGITILFDARKNKICLKDHISKRINIVLIFTASVLCLVIEFIFILFVPLLNESLQIVGSNPYESIIVGIITTCIATPIFEEIIFRFGLYEKYKSKINIWLLMTILSIIFGIIHLYGIVGTIAIAITGFIYHIIYYKTNNLVNSILTHAVYNGASLYFGTILIEPNLTLFLILTVLGIFSFFITFLQIKKENGKF